jgi:acetoin utilization deacetylase AcuC-like enzyme
MPLAYLTHPDCLKHEMGRFHPEQPARLNAIEDRLISSGLEMVLHRYEAPKATRAQLLRVHTSSYVDAVFGAAPDTGLVWLDGDTAMNVHSLDAALAAAGAVVKAVDLVIGGAARSAFCAVRPPGHHAERQRAMGFCIFNNIAVGAAHALEAHGLERVAVVDFDVHHGNGTEDAFADDPRVLFCSTFQHPFYPNTGLGAVGDTVVNVPLASNAGGREFREAVETRWLPAIDAFRPRLILISAGFDAHLEDDMAHLALREPDYAWVTDAIKALADTHAGGRVVSALEGGYALDALARSVVAHLDSLLGHP